MKLHVFQSSDGDCLLLQGTAGGSMLCDGGRKGSMETFVRKVLPSFGPAIDAAYISHVDSDHISGVLQLLEDEVRWRIFDRHTRLGTPRNRRPTINRPPTIGRIFHNAFRDQLQDGDTSDEIENSLAIAASSLFAANVDALNVTAAELQNIATGIPEAIEVSRLAPPLNIPINAVPGKPPVKLLMATGDPNKDVFTIGSMTFTIVGPRKKELRDLQAGWKNWLRVNGPKVATLREELQRRIDEFSAGVSPGSPFDLGQWNGIDDVKGVSTPNVASLVFLVEDNGSRLLLTGDAQPDILLDGLTNAGFVQNGALHVNVLKVQHHGSSHNVDPNFARTVSADDYVFCGNGRHGNPDLPVLDIIYNSRLGTSKKNLARSPIAAGRPFRFWFSTSSDQMLPDATNRPTFQAIEASVANKIAQSGGLMTAVFNGRGGGMTPAQSFVTLNIP